MDQKSTDEHLENLKKCIRVLDVRKILRMNFFIDFYLGFTHFLVNTLK